MVPKLDTRDSSDILNEIKNLSKQYTPEWNFDENSDDFGVVFAKIFASMTESTLSRYNKTSFNHYLTFLNMLGTKLRPSYPASGMIIVGVSKGTGGAYIEKGSPIFADAETEDGTVIYETLDSLTAIDTNIRSIYFTEFSSDQISKIYERGEDSENFPPFRVFDNVFLKNLQSHEIYIADDAVFDMKKPDITFTFYNNMSDKSEAKLEEIFGDTENVVYQAFDGDKWVDAKNAEKVPNGIRLTFEKKPEFAEIMNENKRFLRVKFKKIPENEIAVTSIKYKTKSDVMPVDDMFVNAIQLPKNDFFPFEEQYNLFSSFHFACSEAFSKKGAMVEVTANMQFVKVQQDIKAPGRQYKILMNDVDFEDLEPEDIEIEKICWEYWNGRGWSRLFDDDSNDEFFRVKKEEKNKENIQRTIKFTVPKDIEKVTVGSSEGYFIRARISKMHNTFDYAASYISPYVSKIEIKYGYKGNGHECKYLIVNSGLIEQKLKIKDFGTTKVLENTLCSSPAMYFCIEKPLIQGMIRLLVDIEEGIHRFNPVVKWEYLADDHKGAFEWKHIDVMDETDSFSHTGTVSMVGRSDFKKHTLFGQNGYFIRIINPDKKYENKENIAGRPIINNIKFNAVRIIQKDTRRPEYFSIKQDEENKVCALSFPNIASVEVWVDELGKISTKEQEIFLKKSKDEIQPEYDEMGKLEKLWVKWNPVSNLIAYGTNDRVYEVDYPKGEILFGSGKNGKIPPEQYNESIRINYSICNGSLGNVDAHTVKDFVKTVPNTASIDNPTPIMGGVDMETIDDAARRMFGKISGGNRLVSLEDFEQSIKANDRNIYKVKCLSHTNEESKKEIGITSIAVLPREFMQGFEKFQGIKNRIWEYLDSKAPVTLSNSSRLRIFEVNYVETCVSIEASISDFNAYQTVSKGISEKLKEFLNPVTGNFSKKGWKIGEFPRKELIYNYIKSVPHMKWIKKINIFTKLITPDGKKEIDFERIKDYKFAVPVFGEPKIEIVVEE